MQNKLKLAVEMLFENAPRNKKTMDLKDELISNLLDKYNDLVAMGKSEDEAYSLAVASIGDVEELIHSLNVGNPLDTTKVEAARQKTAKVVTISVGLYIFSIIALIAMEEIFRLRDEVSVLVFLGIIGGTTCYLIYHFMTRPTYAKIDDTLVEEFKEWKQTGDQKKQLQRSINSIVWTLITIIYLVISFTFHIWWCSWIIFLIGAVIEKIIKLLFEIREMRG